MITVEQILDDLLTIAERIKRPMPRFFGTLDDTLEAFESGDDETLGVCLFQLGLMLGTDEYRDTLLIRRRKQQQLRSTGKSNAIASDLQEKLTIYRGWQREINLRLPKCDGKIGRAFRKKPTIPIRRFYAYQRELLAAGLIKK